MNCRDRAIEIASSLVDRLDARRNELGWSVYKLAQESGIHTQTLYPIFRREALPTLPIYIQLLNALDMRYRLDKSKDRDRVWLCTDTLNNIVIEWQEGDFNDTQKVTYLFDVEPSASDLARQMRELGDWLVANHPELL